MVVLKFLGCLVQYLFWGKSLFGAITKIALWTAWLLLFLKPTDKLVLAKEGGAPVLSLETGTFALLFVGACFLLVAIGASCVRVKSLLFKVSTELEPDESSRIFRLRVDRYGWFVDAEAPAAKVQKVVDKTGNSAFPAAPFEIVWSHQSVVGQRPKFSGRGPMDVNVFIVRGPDMLTRELYFCGINGNELRVDQSIRFSEAERLWVEISVAEFIRWFSVEPDPNAPLGFRVIPDLPPALQAGTCRRIRTGIESVFASLVQASEGLQRMLAALRKPPD